MFKSYSEMVQAKRERNKRVLEGTGVVQLAKRLQVEHSKGKPMLVSLSFFFGFSHVWYF